MKSLLFLLLFITNSATAQNRLKELFALDTCNTLSCKDQPLKTWVDSLVGNLVISDLQTSTSTKEDSKFFSFGLLSRRGALMLSVPNTPLRILLATPFTGRMGSSRTNTISLQYERAIQGMIPGFKISNFDFSQYNYYRIRCDILQITDDQLVANTLNFFVDPEDTSRQPHANLFIRQVNRAKKMKLTLPTSENQQIDHIISELRQTKTDVYQLVYDVYLKQKDSVNTQRRINRFFKSWRDGGIISEMNQYFNSTIKLNFGQQESLLVPATWVKRTTDTGSSAYTALRCQYAEFLLNYANHQIEIIFKADKKDTLKIISGISTEEKYWLNNTKEKYTVDHPFTTAIQHLKLVVGLKETTIQLMTADYNEIDMYRKETD